MVADALNRMERLKMVTTSDELIKEFEHLELEIKISRPGNERLFEIRVEPELIQKTKRKVMEEGGGKTTMEERRCE